MANIITFSQKGDFSKSLNFMQRLKELFGKSDLDAYAQRGVEALRQATPIDSGLTANSWGYDINYGVNSIKLTFTNSNIQNGVPIAIILQYGHRTGTGGWVQGRDYINPTVQKVFDDIVNDIVKEVNQV
jgi:hypothetical protein